MEKLNTSADQLPENVLLEQKHPASVVEVSGDFVTIRAEVGEDIAEHTLPLTAFAVAPKEGDKLEVVVQLRGLSAGNQPNIGTVSHNVQAAVGDAMQSPERL